VFGADGSPVASCGGNDPGFGSRSAETYERRDANARLIAAAPELYASAEETHAWVRRIQDVLTCYLVPDGYDSDEALNRLLEMLDGPEQREIQGRALAAIAKARGND
jgi:hypothetical protein